MTSLEEAVRFGRGVERPFRCHVHENSSLTASVNVLKGLWYCYSCQAKGTVDGKRIPTVAELWSMLEPETAVRQYPEEWLDLFGWGGYWGQRFPDWLCWWASFGEDPLTGDATFPVRTPNSVLAGIGRRLLNPPVAKNGKPMGRYHYPPRWSASRVLHGGGKGARGITPPGKVLTLVEGAADTTSIWELGAPALGCYGAGIHAPQVDQLFRQGVDWVLLGFDMDDAGERAARLSAEILEPTGVRLDRVHWPKKDPAECSVAERMEALCSVVGDRYRADWRRSVEQMTQAWRDYVEELP